MSIEATQLVTAHLKGQFAGMLAGKVSHSVDITIKGRRDLDTLAANLDRHGNASLAAKLRTVKSYTVTVSPEQWAALLAAK